MPADAPSDTVLVALFAGREALIGRPERGWPSHVYLELSAPVGVTAPPLIFDKWPLGSASGRRLLVREGNLSEAEALQVDIEAVNFRDAWRAYEQEAAAAQAVAEAQAAEELALREQHRINPTAANWGLLNVECWATGSKDTRRSIPVDSLDAFAQLCEQPQGEGVHLQWAKTDAQLLSVVDCDFHVSGSMPTPPELDELMTSLQPTPPIRHRTTRGFHAWYAPLDGLKANDLAAAAAAHLTLTTTFRTYRGTVEIITRTKHPKSRHFGRMYGPLQRLIADTEIPLLHIFDRVACTEAEREEIMLRTGLRVGQRLSHAHCPLDPHHASTSGAPVVVSDHGVLCFSCQGRLGNGFVSWGALRRQHGLPTVANGDTTLMRDAIRQWAPHAHVSRLLETLAPHFPAQFHKALHRVLLAKHHQGHPGITEMLRATLDEFPYVRNADGLWCHADTLRPTSPRLGRSALGACSMALRPVSDDDGMVTLKPDPNLVSVLETNGRVPGLYPLVPTVLSPIWHVHHQTTRPGCLAVQPRDPTKHPLTYLKPSDRVSFEEAKAAIEQRWPGINWNYLTLLHIARGWGEEGTSQMPMIWATGETGCAKTSTVDIECALHDESPLRLTVPHDRVESLDEDVAAAQGRNGMLLLDDFCKNLSGKLGMARLDNTTAFLLRFNRSVGYHEMYVGESMARVTTPLVMTDMRHPAELVQNEQIGRRVVMVHLSQQVDWGKTAKGFIDWWRTPELRPAVESWHSWVVDQYFSADRPPSFMEMAKSLGFPLLREMYGQQEDAVSREILVREFVQGLLRCPEASGEVSGTREQTSEQMAVRRARGPGWVILNNRSRRPLEDAAQTLCHSLNYDHIVVDGLKKALEPYQARLHELVPFSEPVRIDVEGYRRDAVVVRLRAAKRAKPMHVGKQTLVEGATADNLLDPAWSQAEEVA